LRQLDTLGRVELMRLVRFLQHILWRDDETLKLNRQIECATKSIERIPEANCFQ
jgi:hypothetical protein